VEEEEDEDDDETDEQGVDHSLLTNNKQTQQHKDGKETQTGLGLLVGTG
jgi:hypothetical protein